MEQEDKKESYEIAFWTKEEGGDAAKRIISKHGAVVEKEKPVQKMRLSFPIKKENFAFLGTIVFSAGPEKISAISSELNLESGILRYFLRRAKKPGAENRNEGTGEAGLKERKSFFRMREERRGPEKILTNEALEKKIEEILQ